MRLAGVIAFRSFPGPFTRVHMRVDERTTLAPDIPSQQARDSSVARRIRVIVTIDACQVLPRDKQEVRPVKQADNGAV